MTILLGVIALFALLSLVVAAFQAMAILRLAPAGEHLGSFMLLGWWKFGQLEAKAGAGAEPHLQIYKRSAIAFILFVVLGVVVSGWVVSRAPQDSTAADASGLISNPTSARAEYAFTTFPRRVALMPGLAILES